MESLVKKAVKRVQTEMKEKNKANIDLRRKPLEGDEDLQAFLESAKANIKVVGVGGGGGNTIQRMKEVGIEGVEIIAINTDAQDLLHTNADKRILIGKDTARGLGAGSDPSIGEAAAKETVEELTNVLAGTDLLFITCGLGGGTGTGASPIVAEIGKEINALTVAVVTLPFNVEGKQRMLNAMEGLAKLQENVDTIIIIPNDKILEIAPDLPINAAFKVADEVLTNAVKGITELITKPGLINLDFADLRTILRKGGGAMIGLGESKTEEASDDRALEAVENALTSPLLDVDISKAKRALINVIGGSDMTLREAEMIVETVSSKIDKDAHIIWGAIMDDTLPKNQIQSMVIIAGGRFPFLDKGKVIKGSDLDLGIEFTG